MNTFEQEYYLELIYKCENGSQEVEDFYAYKNKILPDKIYRYQRCNNENFEAIKNNYIWLSNPDNFNDVHDSKVNIDSDLWVMNNVFESYNLSQSETKLALDLIYKVVAGLDFEMFKHILNSEQYIKINEILNHDKDIIIYQEFYKKFQKYNNPHKEKVMKVNSHATCFSGSNDNILMWAHYADWNKGFCIEYDISTNYEFKRKLYPIIYLSEPVFKPKLIGMEISISQTIFGTSKCDKWSYENEYRFFGKKSGIYAMKTKPSCIYLGKNINIKDEQKIVKIAKSRGFPLIKKMLTIPGKYELTSEIIYKE